VLYVQLHGLRRNRMSGNARPSHARGWRRVSPGDHSALLPAMPPASDLEPRRLCKSSRNSSNASTLLNGHVRHVKHQSMLVPRQTRMHHVVQCSAVQCSASGSANDRSASLALQYVACARTDRVRAWHGSMHQHALLWTRRRHACATVVTAMRIASKRE